MESTIADAIQPHIDRADKAEKALAICHRRYNELVEDMERKRRQRLGINS